MKKPRGTELGALEVWMVETVERWDTHPCGLPRSPLWAQAFAPRERERTGEMLLGGDCV